LAGGELANGSSFRSRKACKETRHFSDKGLGGGQVESPDAVDLVEEMLRKKVIILFEMLVWQNFRELGGSERFAPDVFKVVLKSVAIALVGEAEGMLLDVEPGPFGAKDEGSQNGTSSPREEGLLMGRENEVFAIEILLRESAR
jgi:hypothetical protein